MNIIRLKELKENDLTVNLPDVSVQDPPAYNTTTNYKEADIVRYGTDIYYCIKENTNIPPTNNTYWEKISKVNKYKFIDNIINTQTISNIIENNLYILRFSLNTDQNSVLYFGNVDAESIKIELAASNTIYTSIIPLYNEVTNYYDYFFSPYTKKNELITNIPQYYGVLTITITSQTPVKLGQFAIGTTFYIGEVATFPSLSIIDYSKKEQLKTTDITLKQGTYSKKAEVSIIADMSRIDAIYKFLVSIRATIAIYVINEFLESFVIYGFYRDFNIEPIGNKIKINLTLESLT